MEDTASALPFDKQLAARYPIEVGAHVGKPRDGRAAVVVALSATLLGSAPSFGAPATEFPYLPDEAPHSVSIGDTSHGRLVAGHRLEESDALGILPHQKVRGYRWGTKELTGMLTHAANELHRATGTRMWVGHLSRREGGDISYSVSHNAGRDADIAFAYRDAEGAPVDPDALIPVGARGHTFRRGVLLDVARTWQIVKALIGYEHAQVQYLFMSRAIEGQLLAHAKASGEAPALRARAAVLIRQPGRGAAKHDDHIHLRIFCSKDDVLAGCVNTGKIHPSTKLFRGERALFVRELARRLGDEDPRVRERAALRLGVLRAKLAAPRIIPLLRDPDAAVQRAAALTLARFGQRSHLTATRRWLKAHPAERVATARALAACNTRGAGELLAYVIDQPAPRDERVRILSAAAESRHLGLVPTLTRLLGHSDSDIYEHAARALGRLTGEAYAPLSAASVGARALEQKRWKSAWARGRNLSRRKWLLRGFHRAGFDAGKLEPQDAYKLVRALRGPDHIAHNAAAILEELFDHRPSDTSPCEGWRRWLNDRRRAFELGAAPEHLCE